MLFLLLAACGNECDYFQACDGDTLLVCGESVDQQVNRKIHEFPCEAPNSVCVTTEPDRYATCAADEAACVEGDAPACDGNVLLTCVQALLTYEVSDGSVASDVWLWQGTDCAADGLVCGDTSGSAACEAG